MKLTQEQAESIRRQDLYDIIEETPWEDGGKFSSRDIIFKVDDKFYRLLVYRSGSYFTDYEYDYELDCPEVIKVTKMIEVTEWEII